MRVRPLVVIALEKGIEALLLLQHVGGGRLVASFFSVSPVTGVSTPP
jgi:hypothetical protein